MRPDRSSVSLFVACPTASAPGPSTRLNMCLFSACGGWPKQPDRASFSTILSSQPALFSEILPRNSFFCIFRKGTRRWNQAPSHIRAFETHTHTHTHTARERLFLDFTSNSPPLLSVFFYYLSFACPGTFARPASSSVSHIKAQVAGVCV